MADLSVSLNRLALKNPILVASGTFGYAKEMTAFVDFAHLGGIFALYAMVPGFFASMAAIIGVSLVTRRR